MGGLLSKGFDPATDLCDLSGKVVIVTGGNTGLGYATVKALARQGAKVYMAARNESRATGALASLEHEGVVPGSVVWLKLDLKDLKGVKKAAEEFLSRETRLDILVNNAAILTDEFVYGLPETMVTNHLGPVVFTRTLLPRLIETAAQPGSDVRILNLTSGGHQFLPNGIRFRTREDFNPDFSKAWFPYFTRVFHSKLANILFSTELQKRLLADQIPILVLAVHPGFVNTFTSLPFQQFSGWAVSWVAATPDDGARTSLISAASPIPRREFKRYQGGYMVPVGQLGKPSLQAQSGELAAELWQLTEQVVEEVLSSA